MALQTITPYSATLLEIVIYIPRCTISYNMMKALHINAHSKGRGGE